MAQIVIQIVNIFILPLAVIAKVHHSSLIGKNKTGKLLEQQACLNFNFAFLLSSRVGLAFVNFF
jgi:hypothetical protein